MTANYAENLPILSKLNCLVISVAIYGMHLKLSSFPKQLKILLIKKQSSKAFSELSFSLRRRIKRFAIKSVVVLKSLRSISSSAISAYFFFSSASSASLSLSIKLSWLVRDLRLKLTTRSLVTGMPMRFKFRVSFSIFLSFTYYKSSIKGILCSLLFANDLSI